MNIPPSSKPPLSIVSVNSKKGVKKKTSENRGGHLWDDTVNSYVPEYRVYNDQFAQGYIETLKKKKRYKQYLNMIS